jgi:hypothetical protein
MAPSLNDLRERCDNALSVYLSAIDQRKRVLAEAMNSQSNELYAAYALAAQNELTHHKEYWELANALHEALLRRPHQ